MKSTYTAPTLIARGDVVRDTLSAKGPTVGESLTTKKPGGSNLSFGL